MFGKDMNDGALLEVKKDIRRFNKVLSKVNSNQRK